MSVHPGNRPHRKNLEDMLGHMLPKAFPQQEQGFFDIKKLAILKWVVKFHEQVLPSFQKNQHDFNPSLLGFLIQTARLQNAPFEEAILNVPRLFLDLLDPNKGEVLRLMGGLDLSEEDPEEDLEEENEGVASNIQPKGLNEAPNLPGSSADLLKKALVQWLSTEDYALSTYVVRLDEEGPEDEEEEDQEHPQDNNPEEGMLQKQHLQEPFQAIKKKQPFRWTELTAQQCTEEWTFWEKEGIYSVDSESRYLLALSPNNENLLIKGTEEAWEEIEEAFEFPRSLDRQDADQNEGFSHGATPSLGSPPVLHNPPVPPSSPQNPGLKPPADEPIHSPLPPGPQSVHLPAVASNFKRQANIAFFLGLSLEVIAAGTAYTTCLLMPHSPWKYGLTAIPLVLGMITLLASFYWARKRPSGSPPALQS